MHQTTVRFGPDLWEAVEAECERLGVSAAHYVREAALARLSYTAGQRGDQGYARALAEAGAAMASSGTSGELHDQQLLETRLARVESSEQGFAAAAVTAQSEQVRRRAREVRAHSEALRRSGGDRRK